MKSTPLIEVTKPGLREVKIAKQKFQLYALFIRHMQTLPLSEVNIDALCSEAMISRVTFYRYFPTRESILSFLSSVWAYKIKTGCRLKNYEGLEALGFMFRFMADEVRNSNFLFSSMLSIIRKKNHPELKRALTLAEMRELFPNGNDDPENYSYSIGEFVMKNVELAKKKKQISSTLSTLEIACLFGTLFHGSALSGMITFPEDPGKLFDLNFKSLVKLITKK